MLTLKHYKISLQAPAFVLKRRVLKTNNRLKLRLKPPRKLLKLPKKLLKLPQKLKRKKLSKIPGMHPILRRKPTMILRKLQQPTTMRNHQMITHRMLTINEKKNRKRMTVIRMKIIVILIPIQILNLMTMTTRRKLLMQMILKNVVYVLNVVF